MTVTGLLAGSLVVLTASSAAAAVNLDGNDALWSHLVDDDSLTPEHLEVLFRRARDLDEEGDGADENGFGRPAFKEVEERPTPTTAAAADAEGQNPDSAEIQNQIARDRQVSFHRCRCCGADPPAKCDRLREQIPCDDAQFQTLCSNYTRELLSGDGEEESPISHLPSNSPITNTSEDDDVQGLDGGEDEDVPFLVTAVTAELNDEQLSTTEGAESTTATDDFDTATFENGNEIDATTTRPQTTTETSEITVEDAESVGAKEKLVTDPDIDANVIDDDFSDSLKDKADENSTDAEIALFKEVTEKPEAAPAFDEEMRSG